jgi:outer membrane protein OmpA-like peptidoglycan-associated protein
VSDPETQDPISTEDVPSTPRQSRLMAWKVWLNPTLMIATVLILFISLILSLNSQKKKSIEPKDIMAAQAVLAAKTAKINAERASQGLPPITGFGAEAPEQIAARLSKDATTLAGMSDQLRQLLVEKEKIIAEKNNQLLVSEQARQALTSQLGKLQLQLENNLSAGATVDALRAQLTEARNQLEAAASRPTREQFLALQERNTILEAKLNALANQPAPAAPAPAPSAPVKLFADTANDLIPMGKGLYQGLSSLEDHSDLEISAAYNRFATQYRATFLKEVRFPSGSSQLNPADQMAIAEALSDAPEGAMFLVVGYASTTGQADENRKLSSDRATVVASNLEQAKPGNQVVQAVYLGQTKRFSSRMPERNQVCEIWQINP